MHYRTLAALTGALVLTSLLTAPRLHAQAASTLKFQADARAFQPARSAGVIYCSPAPLTERPGIQWEFAATRAAPAVFAAAARPKRSVASLRMKNER